MSALEEITKLFKKLNIPAQTTEFTSRPIDEYAVFTPISDTFDVFSDDMPNVEINSIRVTLFTKGNYILLVKKISAELLGKGFTITDRRFVNREIDTGYNHYAIDCEKFYLLEE